MFKRLVPLIAAIFACSPMAALADGWTGVRSIDWIYPYINGVGAVFVKLDAPGDSCATDVFVLRDFTGGGQEAYSAILAAFMAGKTINLAYKSCQSGWQSEVRAIVVYK